MKTMCVIKLLLRFFSRCKVCSPKSKSWEVSESTQYPGTEIHKKNYYKHKAEVKTLEVPVVFPISAEKE